MKLFGKNPVLERIKSNPKSIRQIFIEEGHPESTYIFKKCNQHKIPVSKVPYTKIQKLANSTSTQGLLAQIDDFAYMDYSDLLAQAIAKKRSIIFLDNIKDPQNLGVVMRSAGALGGFDIVLPTSESVSVTEAVLRVACGGENFLNVAKVANLANAIGKAREEGFWIAATAINGATPLNEIKFQYPLGLVLGSEDKGVREIILKKADSIITIPMKHERMSLNVAQAASIICFEILRQRA